MILLPGMDGSGELFTDFVAALPREIDARVIAFPNDQALSYAALAERIAPQLPREGAFALLGESFSGPLAISLAAAHGPRVRALILSSSFVRNPMPALAQLRTLVDLVPIDLLPKRLIIDYFLADTEDERLMQHLLEVSDRLTPDVWRARVKAAMTADASAQLKQIEAPILYLRAQRDRLVPSAQAALVKQLAPQTKIVDFDTPHFLLQVAPERAAKMVGDFVREAFLAANS